jgi:ADP-heptose:LPS heptosyltransferase
MDATPDEAQVLADLGVRQWSQEITNWADTAGLVHHCDVVISADTALAHLGGALGRPTWVMLNRYAQDWRWLLDRSDSAWYATVRLFRQPEYDAWQPVIDQVSRYLGWFKV